MRALNLSAQSDVVEIHNRLAGFNAMSSANTYPVIKVGQPNRQEFDLTKEINDERSLVSNTLNPSYFKSYELDAQFPNDWKLEVKIMNKGTIFASPIGETYIDLEDRFFGDRFNKQKLSYELTKKEKEKELRDHEQNPDAKSTQEEHTRKTAELRKEITKITGLLENINKPEALVEYKPLTIPGKITSQGSVEMFLEVLTPEVARTQPVAKIEPPKPAEYEIRLIIYETFDIPRINQVNIFQDFSICANHMGNVLEGNYWRTNGLKTIFSKSFFLT